MAKRYLLKAWQPSRGTSEDNPAYYAGPGNYFLHHPLTRVNPDMCYKTEKAAKRVAMKYNGGQLYVRYRVMEVPENLLRDDLMTSSKLYDALKSLQNFTKEQIDAAIHYLYMKASDDEIQEIDTREDIIRFAAAHST